MQCNPTQHNKKEGKEGWREGRKEGEIMAAVSVCNWSL
jgi:hypothetical protein